MLQIQWLNCWGRFKQHILYHIEFCPVFLLYFWNVLSRYAYYTIKTQDELVFFLCFYTYFSPNKACEFKDFCCKFSNLLGSNLDELLDELYTFAELAAEEYLGGNPKLDLVASLKQKTEILSVFSTALSAECEVYQLLLEDTDNIIRDSLNVNEL